MKNIRDDVALSEVIGFVLLLGLVVAALSLYMVYVVPITGREAEIAQLNVINEQFTDYKFTLDNIRTSVQVNNQSPIMTSTSFNLGTGGGNTQAGGFFLYMVQPASSSATLSINTTGDTFNIDSSKRQYYMANPDPVIPLINEFPINITALEYRSYNHYWIQQKYSYQLGGVFLSQDDVITNRISPLISFANTTNGTVVVNIVPVQVVGGGSISGNGPARLDTRLRILPKYNISTDPFVSNTWVNISVTCSDNATAKMWLNIFNDTAIREKLVPAAYTSGISPVGSKPTTAFINITGTNPYPKAVSLYVQRSEFYVAFNNITAEGGTTSTPTPTTTTTTTPTPTPTTTPTTTPTFVSIAPSTGPITGGTGVTITGTNLIGATALTFGGTSATGMSVISDTSITATTPAHAAGAVNVVITTPNGTATGTGAYTYGSAPTFVSIVPSSGLTAGGTGVTITGTNLIGATAVTFGGTSATGVSAVNSTSITATTPAHAAGAVTVVITTPNGTATGTGAYTYSEAPPTFVSIVPSSGRTAGGTGVTITGTNLIGATAVAFDGTSATGILVVSSTSITATTPAHAAGAVTVVITTPNGTATGTNAYTYVSPPTFTSITPNSGPTAGGTTVTIAGTNFVSGGSFGVTIGGSPATSVVRTSSTQITAVTPAGTGGAKDVVITNNDGQTATGANAYTYVSPPTFTSITPNSGPTAGGTTVTIAGTNFVSGGSFGVTIGGSPATSVVWNSYTQITAVTPAGTAGAKDVVITNNDGQTATGTGVYTYVSPPTFTSITPNSGPTAGGTAVTIAGTNFVSGGSFGVTIGGSPATSVVRTSSTQITAVTPAGTTGTRDVVITNNDGQTATGTGAYTYLAPAPTVTSITPNTGLRGTTVSITNLAGTNFVVGTTPTVQLTGGATVTATSVVVSSSTRITCTFTLPGGGSAGTYNVVVTNTDGQSGTLTGGFTITK